LKYDPNIESNPKQNSFARQKFSIAANLPMHACASESGEEYKEFIGVMGVIGGINLMSP